MTGGFWTSFQAVLEIALLALAGFVWVRKGWVPRTALPALSRVVVDLALPSLIFHRILTAFTPAFQGSWWVFPLMAALLVGTGAAVGQLLSRVLGSEAHRREVTALSAFQNSGYLPLTLTLALFPQAEAARYHVAIFLFILGFNPLLWSLGVRWIAGKNARPPLLTPPLAAVLLSLLFVFTGLRAWIPPVVLHTLQTLGGATIPLGMFLVGGILGSFSVEPQRGERRDTLVVVLTRLVLLPGLVWMMLPWLPLSPLARTLLFIESMMPSAVNTAVIAERYGGNSPFIARTLLITHLLALLTLPLWLGLAVRFRGLP